MNSDPDEGRNIPPPRGRPVGKNDSTKRYRRTAQEISSDKIRVAQMRLDALREMEEKRIANKKPRTRPSRQSQAVVEESELPRAPKKVVIRGESPPTPVNRKHALYGSWFTRRYWFINKQCLQQNTRCYNKNISARTYSRKCLPIVIGQGRQKIHSCIASQQFGIAEGESAIWP